METMRLTCQRGIRPRRRAFVRNESGVWLDEYLGNLQRRHYVISIVYIRPSEDPAAD